MKFLRKSRFSRMKLKISFFLRKKNTTEYWEARYKARDISGSGSAGTNLDYKISLLKNILLEKEVNSVIDLGCGQSAVLTGLDFIEYLGIDVSSNVINENKQRFPNRKFYELKVIQNRSDLGELVLSSEVIFCLNRKELDEHLQHLNQFSTKYIAIFTKKPRTFLVLPWTPNLKWRPLENWQLLTELHPPKQIANSLHFYLFLKSDAR